jgi:hypothetical protein
MNSFDFQTRMETEEWLASQEPGGGWRVEAMPTHGWRVVDATGQEVVADVYRKEDAMQIVADHNAVGLLADMLGLALANSSHTKDCKSRTFILKSGIDAREQCTCWRREVDAALTVAGRQS